MYTTTEKKKAGKRAGGEAEPRQHPVKLDWVPGVYVLTAAQWRVISVLYDATESGFPEVSTANLLRASEAEGVTKLKDLFKGDGLAAWDGLIRPGRKSGYYRLPPKPPGAKPSDPLADYPTLSALLEELQSLRISEEHRRAKERRERTRTVNGVWQVRLDFAGRHFWLTAAQQAAVRLLVDHVGKPVHERDLVAGGTLKQLFAGNEAWGTLVIPGKEPGTYLWNFDFGTVKDDENAA